MLAVFYTVNLYVLCIYDFFPIPLSLWHVDPRNIGRYVW